MTQAVLQICLSKGWGGLEMYPARISKWLPRNNWKPFCLALKDGNVAQAFKKNDIECFEVKNAKDAFSKIFKISKWIKQNQISIIHCHKSSDIKFAVFLKYLTGIKIIFTEHMGGMRPKKDIFHKFIYRHVDKVLSISNETRNRNLRTLPINPNKIHTLWLGTEFISPNISPIQLKTELNIKTEDYIIGIPGRLCPGKGHLIIVDVIHELLKENEKIKLLIVGGLKNSEGADGDFVHILEKKIETLNIAKYVCFTGFRADIQNLYQIMDVVCIPSENEAFGLTAIEAMAASRKIIASNSGALPEILEKVALFANPTNPAEWILKIKEMIKSDINYGSKAKSRAEKYFSIQKHTEELAKFYSQYKL